MYVSILIVTVTFTFDRLTSKSIGIIYTKTHVCAKFDKPRSIPCLVIIRTRYCLYVNMLKVTVTLSFDGLTSKSIGIIYNPRRMSVPNLTNLGVFCVVIWTKFCVCQYIDSFCDLELWPIDLKINMDHLHPQTHVCAKFYKPRSILCLPHGVPFFFFFYCVEWPLPFSMACRKIRLKS